jgi:SAM-dependent methyltransferase
MEVKRRRFQGLWNILSFNRHFYVIGLTILSILFVTNFLVKWPSLAFGILVGAFLYGLIMPLLVSAYVYDLSGYYKLDWMNELTREYQQAGLIVNINAGFDETSFIIKRKFPRCDLHALDFYDARRHTEPAIKRARKVSLVYPGTQQVSSGSLPLADHSVDLIFLLSAVHEIRSQEEKVLFLTECHRLCKPGGKVVMVEHLRDLPNFLAFSVGFTHFFSRAVWKEAFEHAGFASFRETKFTPFLSIFECTPYGSTN